MTCISRTRQALLGLLTTVLITTLLPAAPAHAADDGGQVGFKAHSFEAPNGEYDAGKRVTDEKPESKLWYHDGSWWATMIQGNPDGTRSTSGAHTIHRLVGDTWDDTGVEVDPSALARGDALVIENRLYIANRTTSTLFRATYDGETDTWSPDDSGNVVLPVGASATALTIARDSDGELWLTWVEADAAYYSRSSDDGAVWSEPAMLPFAEARSGTKLSAVIAFHDEQGPAIGIMWTRQANDDSAQHFAVHRDGGWALETAVGPGSSEADDHINLKTKDGAVYAAVKTEANETGQTLVKLLVRSPGGDWQQHPVALHGQADTRPIVVLELSGEHAYVFMSRKPNGEGPREIVYKRAQLSEVDPGSGDANPFDESAVTFIRSDTSQGIDDVTSMKANPDATSDLVVLASTSSHYWWNRLEDGGAEARYSITTPVEGDGQVTPDPEGPYTTGTHVSLTATPAEGWSFTGWTGDHESTDNPTTVTVGEQDLTITATFTQDEPVMYTLTTGTDGEGIVTPSTDVFQQGSTVDLEATPAEGWAFAGWSGDLSGDLNPMTITMESDTLAIAVFKQLRNLTTDVVGSGTVALDPPGGTYVDGTTVGVTATPADGWTFSGWSGSLTGTENPTTILMDGDRAVTASFTEEAPSTGGGSPGGGSTGGGGSSGGGGGGGTGGSGGGSDGGTEPDGEQAVGGATVSRGDGPVTACDPNHVPDGGFADVDGSVHRAMIDCIAWYRITLGDGDGQYLPDLDVTRAQMASFLARLAREAGLALPADPADAFGDDDGHTHEAAINQLAELGIIAGRGDVNGDGRDDYAPDASVTRAQMASFLTRLHTAVGGRVDGEVTDAFSDDDGSTHEAAINQLHALGVADGVGDGRYAPERTVSRAAMGSFLGRHLDLLADQAVAWAGAARISLAGETADDGSLAGRVDSHHRGLALSADGCGLEDAAVTVDGDAFTITPADRDACELLITVQVQRDGSTPQDVTWAFSVAARA